MLTNLARRASQLLNKQSTVTSFQGDGILPESEGSSELWKNDQDSWKNDLVEVQSPVGKSGSLKNSTSSRSGRRSNTMPSYVDPPQADPPEVVPELGGHERRNEADDGRDSRIRLEAQLHQKDLRVRELEAALVEQELRSQRAAREAEKQLQAAQARVLELEAMLGHAAPETLRSDREAGKAVPAPETDSQRLTRRRSRSDKMSNSVTFNEVQDIVEVDVDGEKGRQSRRRKSTGSDESQSSNASTLTLDRQSSKSSTVTPTQPEDHGILKKSRDRVPTGYLSMRDLFKQGSFHDLDEICKGHSDKEYEGTAAGPSRGRVRREVTQSCKVLMDPKRMEDGGNVTVVNPPMARRRRSLPQLFEETKEPDDCEGQEEADARRGSCFARFAAPLDMSCLRQLQATDSFRHAQARSEGLEEEDFCSEDSTRATEATETTQSATPSVAGSIPKGRRPSCPTIKSSYTPTLSSYTPTLSSLAPPPPGGGILGRSRRKRDKTHSSFHTEREVQQAIQEADQGMFKRQLTPPGLEFDQTPQAPAVPPQPVPQPPAPPMPKATAPPPPPPPEPVAATSSAALSRQRGRMSVDSCFSEPCRDTKEIMPEQLSHEGQLTSLARYGNWRRSQSSSSGPVGGVGQVPKEPSGLLIKGTGTAHVMTYTDVMLLAEAMPLQLSALGLSTNAMAHSFSAYRVHAGEELWREDTPIDYVYIVGEQASLSLSRGGRALRDVGGGQNLGAEALQRPTRWQHTAIVRQDGEVWAADVATLRELVAAALGDEVLYNEIFTTLCKSSSFKTTAFGLQQAMLAAHAEVLDLQKEQCLCRVGEEGCQYYVLQKGAIEVVKDGHVLHRYTSAGQSFGERALLDTKNHRRSATVIATEASTLIALDEELLRAVFGSSLETFLHKSTVRQVLRSKACTDSRLAEVRADTLEAWEEHCVIHSFAPREDILKRADENELEIDADDELGRCGRDLTGMLVVLFGEVRAISRADNGAGGGTMRRGPARAAAAAVPLVARSFEILGQENLLDRPSAWLQTLVAGDHGAQIAALPRKFHSEVFESCVDLSALASYQRRVALVREIFIFRHLSEAQCSKFVKAMTMRTFRRDEVVIREGDAGHEFFIIQDGDLSVSIKGNFITKLSQPAYFGERALLYEEPRAATIKVMTEEATCCVLTKEVFLGILDGGLLDFIAYRNRLLNTDLQFSDLEEQRIIGRGGYGTVKLVRHKTSGTRYALKCVTRDKLSDQDRSLVQRERAILKLIDHPFCLKLVRSFKDPKCVYFLTELVTGGELLAALDRLDVLDRPQAQFYLGSLSVVFDYIHEKNVVYRDLKPENVLLDQDGFIKLIDFGAARKLDNPAQKCYTLLGTPHFMAAEMICGHGYGMSADVWAMGVCLYEFMVGRLPFDGDSPVAIFKQIAAKKPLWVPDDLEPSSADMLRWLLRKEPSDRVQPNTDGYKNMREHPFFQGFDFEALVGRNLAPPVVPEGEVYCEEVPTSFGATPRGDGERCHSSTNSSHSADTPQEASHEVDSWDAEF